MLKHEKGEKLLTLENGVVSGNSKLRHFITAKNKVDKYSKVILNYSQKLWNLL